MAKSNNLPAPSGVPEWAQRLRQAAFDGITEEDMAAIVRAQVDKAKAGDQQAAKFVLEYLVGIGAPAKSITQTINHYGTAKAKKANNGRDLDALADRAARGLPLL